MTDDDTSTESRWSATKRRWARWRDRLRERPKAELSYRIAVGVVGLAVFGVGIIAIPYPGPGWAIEFEWARRLLGYAKERYDKVMDWFRRQGKFVQIIGGVISALIVATTLWLLGALDWTGELVGIEHPWLNSPIGVGD